MTDDELDNGTRRLMAAWLAQMRTDKLLPVCLITISDQGDDPDPVIFVCGQQSRQQMADALRDVADLIEDGIGGEILTVVPGDPPAK